MNIFKLHSSPVMCAQYHADRHVVKMIVEYCQLLSTAHHVFPSSVDVGTLYKRTHENHPSAVWVRESSANYRWLYTLLCFLVVEYTYRYGKTHKCESTGLIKALSAIPNLKRGQLTQVRLAMPDEYKTNNDVESYRNLYAFGKAHLLVWTRRPMPSFLRDYGYVETVNS